MATNKYLDINGVQVLWDKTKRTFLSQEDATVKYLGKTAKAENALTADECSGNAETATRLETKRGFYIQDNAGDNISAGVEFDGTDNVILKMPALIKATLNGKADTADSANSATKADKLSKSRTLQTNLASGNAADFDGSKNVNIGVYGVLAISNGGTGNATGNAVSADKLSTARTLNVQDAAESNVGTGVDFDGSGNALIKLPSIITATIRGNADSATKAEQDTNGNVIHNTYAPLESPDLKGTPQAPTADQSAENNQIATTKFVATAIKNLIGTAPATLDTLAELAQAIDKDKNFAASMAESLAGKQPKHEALTSISNLETSADKMIFTTAANIYAKKPPIMSGKKIFRYYLHTLH